MNAKAAYARAMEGLYLAAIVLSGTAIVVITVIIPAGVFMRYVMNNPMSWPEPAAVVMMVMFSFIGGAAVYRANVHIAVAALTDAVSPGARRVMAWGVNACMAAMALFMAGYGAHLVMITWTQTVAEFPRLPVGVVYAPIPIAGVMTLLFLIERLWVGPPPRSSFMYRDGESEVE